VFEPDNPGPAVGRPTGKRKEKKKTKKRLRAAAKKTMVRGIEFAVLGPAEKKKKVKSGCVPGKSWYSSW
jgi:hypothetical protein